LRVLEERAIPVGDLSAFASRPRERGAHFRDVDIDVRATNAAALRDVDVAFFAGAEDASETFAPALIERGCVVIDNSPAFRMRDGVPLIVPEVNAADVRPEQRLFPVANCTAIVLCVALAPVRDAAGLRTVRAATYQAASGAGRRGLDELLAGERATVVGEREPEPAVFPKVLAHNVIPQIGRFEAGGDSGEERKVREETRKMLGLPELFVSVTAVRVPVRTAHSAAVFFQTERPTSVAALAAAFERAPGIAFSADEIPTPRDVEGTDLVHVARLRSEDGREPTTNFALWCVGDQLRKGAATNAVQILELLLAKGYVRA
jgi:aspartate-semialdehyde dehydrogenase